MRFLAGVENYDGAFKNWNAWLWSFKLYRKGSGKLKARRLVARTRNGLHITEFTGQSLPPEITTITNKKGDIWWVAKEVCDVLEVGNPHSSLALVDEDEKPTIHIMEGLTTCRNPNVTIINESGLYGLILSSRKPEATDEKGEPWFVAKEVCDVLGLGKVGQAVTSLDDNEKIPSLLMMVFPATRTDSSSTSQACTVWYCVPVNPRPRLLKDG